jgi:hypothetical protein
MPKNPYRLAGDIRGIGFKTADTIAMKLGMEKTAMVRIQSGISYALAEAITREIGLPSDELVPLAERRVEVRRPSSHRARSRAGRGLLPAGYPISLRERERLLFRGDGTTPKAAVPRIIELVKARILSISAASTPSATSRLFVR